MAWLQAASVPVALLGAILAFFVGFRQLRQGAESQVAGRFDKALTRLASTEPNERMTGVSGLELFLYDDGSPLLQKQALQFLVNSLSLETHMRVQGAILNALADLPPGRPSDKALDAGLRIAIERNRSLTRSIVGNWSGRIAQQQKQALARFKIPNLDLDKLGDEIPAQVLASLTTEQYLALLDAELGPFERLDPSEDVPLKGLSEAISTLVARGAINVDFTAIYCEHCNFSKAKSLDRAKFDGAYLSRADFAHVSLREASFHNADIGGTNFFGADLTNADLRAEWIYRSQYFVKKGFTFLLPLLECANLRGADLSGQPLVLFEKKFDTTSDNEVAYLIFLPRMISVQLDTSTKLDNFTILTAISISDEYLKQHTAAPEVQPLTKQRSEPWENPLAEGKVQTGPHRLWRFHGTFAEDAPKYTSTYTMIDRQIGAVIEQPLGTFGLQALGKDAFMLRGFIDQSGLKALPFYARFVERVRALSVPEDRAAKAAEAWRHKAANTWARMKPTSCTEHLTDLSTLVLEAYSKE
jgi:hypothetical protein